MLNVEIYEVEYSVSPGGVDCWEMSVESDEGFYQDYSEYKTAGDALNHLVSLFPEQAAEIKVISLGAYTKEELANLYA